MSWYAQQQAPTPWDTCWDFQKGGSKKQSWQGQGGGYGSYSSAYGGAGYGSQQGWGGSTAIPPWWGVQGSMQGAQGFWPSTFGAGMPFQAPPPPPGQSKEPQLPMFLEKRLAERKSFEPPPDKEFQGSLKSLSSRHGYGFIACEETHKLYDRDVYIAKEDVPAEMKVLDRLRFRIGLSPKGHPQAKDVVLLSAADGS
eukprot:gnl/TRDRNA2_/TRDRNA2_44728_c0_seq1.p1 gnl/TRDRNA2_/TRDRNA2_44728_c0~~gnl/TRDRNA2_/TRDRNA2_44728_c0_seq1.p1  ORF type:complete len:219 (+),score=36.89 gnl/TRDRNA2_/TRDRNA2_44728_c0_seq1:69-659(+)